MERVATSFTTAPNTNSVWILENTTLQTTQWRVVSVNEDKDKYGLLEPLITQESLHL